MELTSEFDQFHVTTSRVLIDVTSLTQTNPVQMISEGNFILYETEMTLDSGATLLPTVSKVFPRGFYHYADLLTLTIETSASVEALDCVYGTLVTHAVQTSINR